MDNFFPDDEYQTLLTFSTDLVELETLRELIGFALTEMPEQQAELLHVLPIADPGDAQKIRQALIAEPNYVPATIVISVKSYLNPEGKERPTSWVAETELRRALLVEAEAHGLGIYYRSIYPNPHFTEKVRVETGIATEFLPMACLFLGRPDLSHSGFLQRFESKVKRDKDSADFWSAGL